MLRLSDSFPWWRRINLSPRRTLFILRVAQYFFVLAIYECTKMHAWHGNRIWLFLEVFAGLILGMLVATETDLYFKEEGG